MYCVNKNLNWGFNLRLNKRKTILLVAVFLLTFSSFLSCSREANLGFEPRAQNNFSSSSRAVSEGVYIGGGMLYYQGNTDLSHLKKNMVINLRFSRTEKITSAGEYQDISVDEETGAETGNATGSNLVTTQEIPQSISFGKMLIKEISKSYIKYDINLYSASNEQIGSYTNQIINTGAQVDLNGDSIPDISWIPYKVEYANGYKEPSILLFLSDEDKNNITMYMCPQEASYSYPSGIITINPNGSFIASYNQLEFYSKTNKPETNEVYYSFRLGDKPILGKYDFIHNLNDNTVLAITEDPSINKTTGIVTYVCRIIRLYEAYEIINIDFMGSAEELQSRYNKSTRDVSINIPVPNYKKKFGSNDTFIEFINNNNLKLSLDVKINVNWSSVKSNVKVIFSGDLSVLANAQFREELKANLGEVEIYRYSNVFLIGPVPVFVDVPLKLGADIGVEGYGKFSFGLNAHSALGFEQESEFGLKYKEIKINLGFFKKKIKIPSGIKAKIDLKPIKEFSLKDQNGNNLSRDSFKNFLVEGRVYFNPYFKIAADIYAAKIVGLGGAIRIDLNNSISATLTPGEGYIPDLKLGFNSNITGRLDFEAGFKINLRIWSKDFTKKFGFNLFKIDLFDKDIYLLERPEIPKEVFSFDVQLENNKPFFNFNDLMSNEFNVLINARSGTSLDRINLNGAPLWEAKNGEEVLCNLKLPLIKGSFVQGVNKLTFTLYDKATQGSNEVRSKNVTLSFIADVLNQYPDGNIYIGKPIYFNKTDVAADMTKPTIGSEYNPKRSFSMNNCDAEAYSPYQFKNGYLIECRNNDSGRYSQATITPFVLNKPDLRKGSVSFWGNSKSGYVKSSKADTTGISSLSFTLAPGTYVKTSSSSGSSSLNIDFYVKNVKRGHTTVDTNKRNQFFLQWDMDNNLGDGSTIRFYLNGNLVGSGSENLTANLTSASPSFYLISKTTNTGKNSFGTKANYAELDNIVFWNEVMDAEEIFALNTLAVK